MVTKAEFDALAGEVAVLRAAADPKAPKEIIATGLWCETGPRGAKQYLGGDRLLARLHALEDEVKALRAERETASALRKKVAEIAAETEGPA